MYVNHPCLLCYCEFRIGNRCADQVPSWAPTEAQTRHKQIFLLSRGVDLSGDARWVLPCCRIRKFPNSIPSQCPPAQLPPPNLKTSFSSAPKLEPSAGVSKISTFIFSFKTSLTTGIIRFPYAHLSLRAPERRVLLKKADEIVSLHLTSMRLTSSHPTPAHFYICTS